LRTNTFAAACLLLAAVSTAAADATKAESLLRQADAKLAAASTLSAEYVVVDAYQAKYRDLRQTAVLKLARPGKERLEISRARRVTAADPWQDTGNNTLTLLDGSQRTNVFFHPESTQVKQSPTTTEDATLDEAPLLSGFFSGKTSPAVQVAKARETGELSDLDDAPDGSVHYRIGSRDYRVEFNEDGLISKLTRSGEGGGTTTWTLSKVDLDADLPADAFTYTPPADALPLGGGSREALLDAGSAAPDFTVTDAAGKAVRLSDYRGKVVVLKFWATWCWPCNQSLPHTDEVVGRFKDKGVVALAVAIKDSRKGFDAWLGKHPQFANLQFAFEDPLKPLASTGYHVSATPTVYVIDRDGHIVDARAGFAGPTANLEQAIIAALARG